MECKHEFESVGVVVTDRNKKTDKLIFMKLVQCKNCKKVEIIDTKF